jgi:spermidine/putrescine transport system permease protein
MALIAIMLLVLMAQALAADRAAGRVAEARGNADG